MAIDDKDIKLLWGKAAGRCSYPGCHDDLAPLLLQSGTTVLGEMAHIIGRKPGAARSSSAVGTDDTYLNLLLLCPTHHTLIDKAEKDFPVELLKKWKGDWEGHVAALFLKISDRGQLIHEISTRLAENHQIHVEWGPTSARAKESPQSCQAASYWQLRRIGVIVPNNQAITNLLKANKQLLTPTEWFMATAFIEHAEFFARHCIEPADATAYLPFPQAFAEFISREAANG
jgi:hypothetical protein